MLIVLLESILLSLAGGLLGWLLGHLLIAGLNPWVVAQTGRGDRFLPVCPLELVIIPGLIVLAAIVGYLPAMVAYRTDVAKALVPPDAVASDPSTCAGGRKETLLRQGITEHASLSPAWYGLVAVVFLGWSPAGCRRRAGPPGRRARSVRAVSLTF